MTPEEEAAMLASRMLFRAIDAADQSLKSARGPLASALLRVRDLILGLPEEKLLRESAWKQLRPQILEILRSWNEAANASVVDGVRNAIEEQAGLAQRYLVTTAQPKYIDEDTLRFRDTATERSVPVSSLGAQQIEKAAEEYILRAPKNIERIVRDVRVNQQSLRRIFGSDAAVAGVRPSGFTLFSYNSIDKRVRTGILQGLETSEIAEQIFKDRTGTRFVMSELEGRLMSDAEAIARTAVADATRMTHERVWSENDDVIAAWEFDSTLDSRVCPQCAPSDGLRSTNKKDLPTPPLHPRCRCAVRPLTEYRLATEPEEKTKAATQLFEANQIPGRRPGESTEDLLRRLKKEDPGWYITKVDVGGKPFYRRAIQIKSDGGGGDKRGRRSQVIDYLADQANNTTRVAAFGGSQKRADFFMRQVKKGVDPEKAYQSLLKGKQFKPVAKLE